MSHYCHHSMTGYGKGETIGDNYTLVIEIKAVNHRFKDFRFKMPSLFNSKEMLLKKKLEKNFSRGSFDIFVNYRKDVSKVDHIEIDHDKALSFISQVKELSQKAGVELSIRPTEFLKSDFVRESFTKDEELVSLLYPAFEQAMAMLKKSREDEGKKLIEKLREHQQCYVEYFQKIVKLKDSYQDTLKEKLLNRFEKLSPGMSVDEPRFLQEIIYYLEKLDIEEEVTRIQVHLEKLTQVFLETGDVGRQIEFLLQELGRETNTIGAKSNNHFMSESIVQMKVQLEKIREQALNLQ